MKFLKYTIWYASIIAAMQKEPFGETIARGALVGIAEGITGVPCVHVKNHIQAGHGFMQFPFSKIYRGFGANAFAAGPTTVVQYGINTGLTSLIGDDTVPAQCVTATIAGIIGAGVAAPAELLVMRALDSKVNFIQDTKAIVRAYGLRGLLRGYVPTALRDTLWTNGYFVGPKESPVSLIGTGIAVALMSHPCDTIKTAMQRDISGKVGMIATGCTIVKESGIRGLFAGAVPRSVRIILALGVMDRLDHHVKKIF